MNAGLQALKQEIFASWTYLDVLALAMAKTKGRRFSADPQLWNQLVANFQERFEGEAPELLQDVYFDLRRPGMPYSGQVEAFFRVMAGSGALSLGNPSYQVYEMSNKAKEDIASSQGPVLKEFESKIDEMAEEIERTMAL